MIRILVADDHTVVREGIKQILARHEGMIVEDEAASGQEVLSKVAKKNYDLVLLDISMPGKSGLEVLEEIKVRHPKLPVLILSMHPEEQYEVQAIKAGGNGYVTKRSTPDEVVLAVRRVLNGKRYISPILAERVFFNLEFDGEKPPHAKLSQREFQVACMIGTGKTMKQITAELRLSINTVRTYRVRILQKIGVRGTNELIHYAVKHRLIE